MTRIFVIAAASLLIATGAYAQADLLGARQALGSIMAQPALPSCPDTEQMRAQKAADAFWLYKRLGDVGWEKVPQDYLISLNDLADGFLRLGNTAQTDRSCETLRLLVRDLHTKRDDCEKLGHSRTNIPVEISTVNGKDELKGLEVYTRWLPAGDRFTTVPKRLTGLSSPARGTVPIPGEFEIFAMDPATGKSTRHDRVSIGGKEVFQYPLPIVFGSEIQNKK